METGLKNAEFLRSLGSPAHVYKAGTVGRVASCLGTQISVGPGGPTCASGSLGGLLVL